MTMTAGLTVRQYCYFDADKAVKIYMTRCGMQNNIVFGGTTLHHLLTSFMSSVITPP